MKTLFIILSFVFTLEIQAQISYASTDFANSGDSIHVSTSSTGLLGFDFEQTGAGYTWDYSALPYSSQDDIKWIDPMNAGYNLVWCLQNMIFIGCTNQFAAFTNMALPSRDTMQLGSIEVSNTIDHYNKTTNTFEYKMIGSTFVITGIPIARIAEINDVDTVYNFPIQYNDIDSSECNYTIKISGDSIKYIRYYKRINYVEGWGELYTPYATFGDVLKMKTVLYKKDTFLFAGNSYTLTDTTIEYKWFAPSYKIPVLEADAIKTGPLTTITKVSYIDSVRCIDPTALYIYTPTVIHWDSQLPGAEIDFTNLSINADSSYWDFDDGTYSASYYPTHVFTCPGTYQVKLNVTNRVCNPYRYDDITIPLVVLDTAGYFYNEDTVQMNQGDSVYINGEWQSNAGLYIDTLTSVEGCDSIVSTLLILNSGIHSIIDENNILVYPNPSEGQIHINAETIDFVEVYNDKFQLISRTYNRTIDMKQQVTGIYFIRVASGKQVKTFKCIVL